MQCYNDDDIFIFGFSRGAYVARFLAEMLDHAGLLSQGNQEVARFAWKAFAQWQERDDKTEEEKNKKKEMLQFLWAFRETFSRPVRRIRFLGLFDTGKRFTMKTDGLLAYFQPSKQCPQVRECMDEAEQVSIHCSILRQSHSSCSQYRRAKGKVPVKPDLRIKVL